MLWYSTATYPAPHYPTQAKLEWATQPPADEFKIKVFGEGSIDLQSLFPVNRSNHSLGFRLLRHHLPLMALSTSAIAFFYIVRPYSDKVMRLSFATAYPAIVLLAATLLIGPINVLKRRRNPISNDLRRDTGIWAAIICALHVAIGQCVHLRGRPWLYYVYGPTEKHAGLRHDLFGFSNYTGAFATIVLLLLFATSNDFSLRALGTPRWKALQRWNYLVFGLAALHMFGYQAIEKQKMVWVATLIGCVVTTVAIQTAGILKRRQSSQEEARDLEAGASGHRGDLAF